MPDGIAGWYTITVTATDQWPDTNSNDNTIQFEIYNNNAPTTTETITNTTNLSYHEFTLTLDESKFSDSDNDNLEFILATNASWITTHPSNLTFTGTSEDDKIGNWSLSVTARDPSQAEVTITGYVEVVKSNKPGLKAGITIPEPVPIQMLHDFSFNFSEYFEDPDGEDFTIERISPANYTSLTIDNATKIMSGVETTNIGSEETVTFTFKLRDTTRPGAFTTDIQFLAKPDTSPYLSSSLAVEN